MLRGTGRVAVCLNKSKTYALEGIKIISNIVEAQASFAGGP